ncbi:MAG: TatD family hydrolase [Planctomycetia bacterium]|nr:TatD family hydrolase [Planctomycetia bacterium]
MKTFVDTHCHLDDEAFSDDLSEVLAASSAAGVEKMVVPGTSLASSERCVALSEAFAEIWSAVAIHPNCLTEELEKFPELSQKETFLERMSTLAAHPRVCAIGETGLDLYWQETPLEIQKRFLAWHLELARQKEVPVLLHCREAEAELLEVVRHDFQRHGPVRGILHSFSGNRAFLEDCLELGFLISYSGSVTYTNRKFDALRETVPYVPDDRLLVETDSPYLIPVPFRGKREKNLPALVVHTAECLAALRTTTLEEIAEQTTRNACRFLRLE